MVGLPSLHLCPATFDSPSVSLTEFITSSASTRPSVADPTARPCRFLWPSRCSVHRLFRLSLSCFRFASFEALSTASDLAVIGVFGRVDVVEPLRMTGEELKMGAAAELYSVEIGSQQCSWLKALHFSDSLSLLRMRTGSQCLGEELGSRGVGGISAAGVECQPVMVVSELQLAALTNPEGPTTFQQAPSLAAATSGA
jgi:hypothetical protein